MLATLPVLLIVATAGVLGARHGSSTLWGALAVGTSVVVIVWSFKNSDEPFMSRFLAPVAFYLPSLLLAGFVLSILGNLAWTPLTVSLVAFGAAVSNVFFAPFFSPWELPLICGSLFNSCLGWPPNTRPKLPAPRV